MKYVIDKFYWLKRIKIVSLILWVLSVCTMVYLINVIAKMNMIPNKYMIPGVIAAIVLLLIPLIIIIVKKRGYKLIIAMDIFIIIAMCAELFVIEKINLVYDFMQRNLGSKYEVDMYDIIVNADSKYNSIEDIAKKNVVYYSDLDDDSLLINNINSKIKNVKLEKTEDLNDSFEKLTTDKQYIFIVNSAYLDTKFDMDEEYEKKIKTIGNIEIENEVKVEEKAEEVNMMQEPFVVYISGIDTRSGKLPSRSLTDVNIIMAVNPKNKQILMVHIPRDYYVEVPGKNGAKDKLTHTGSMGGVDLTKKTIENLFDIEIAYYVRVNFNSVVRLVNAIGGIDVYSDVNYKFNTHTMSSLTIYPLQMNHLNGEQALAFARERYAYASGDRHRGENQEQVIQRVIEKMSSSTTLLSKFDKILEALNGTFATNITSEDIFSLVKMQLEDMAKWKIETYNIDGSGSMEYTYSYPKQKLYVMYPNKETISEAMNKLQEVLEK